MQEGWLAELGIQLFAMRPIDDMPRVQTLHDHQRGLVLQICQGNAALILDVGWLCTLSQLGPTSPRHRRHHG